MKFTLPKVIVVAALGAASLLGNTAHAQSFFQGFNDTSLPAGWTTINRSTAPGNPWTTTTAIVDADGDPTVTPHEGARFAVVNFTSQASGTGTISNWLITPTLSLNNGDTFSFFTQTTPGSPFPDRLELRVSFAGSSTNVGTTPTSVGDFSTLLLSVNPSLTTGGYPESWTQFTATITGLSGPTDGRFALRYFVTSGGPTGANSNIIGVDSVQYNAVPEPTTYALFAGGALLLIAAARRRRTGSAAA
jgi:hypothetical protein